MMTLPSSSPEFSPRQFLAQALQARLLSHAYVFRGSHTPQLYQEALCLAQLVNCETLLAATEPAPLKTDFPEPCGQCLSCKWIAGNSHPAVMTVSRQTFLPDAEWGKPIKAATQIRTGQIDQLLHALALSSPYCRVIIMTDAELVPKTTRPFASGDVPPPADWQALQKDDSQTLLWQPLSRQTLNTSAANKMLKTLEEPPARTLFVFLTDHEDQLLETIVSRCQVLPFNTAVVTDGVSTDVPALAALLRECQPNTNAYALSQQFFEVLAEGGQSEVQGVDALQRSLKQQLATANTLKDFQQIKAAMMPLESARRQLLSKANRDQTINHLFLTLCNSPTMV